MKLYAISGLGVDSRLFKFLKLDCDLVPIDWIKPKSKEKMKDYAIRLSNQINTNEDFGLLGVSFGGLMAMELSQLLNPKFTILISSAETKNELRPVYRWIGRLNLIDLLPLAFFKIPKFPASYLFGTQNKTLLYAILEDTDPYFTRWALHVLMSWDNTKRLKNILKISGKNDKLIPAENQYNTMILEHHGHFIIVDQAEEITRRINDFTKTF